MIEAVGGYTGKKIGPAYFRGQLPFDGIWTTWYRKKNLLKRVEVAREDGRGEAANKILAIIKREQERSFWRRINYTCGKVKGKSPISIHVPRNG